MAQLSPAARAELEDSAERVHLAAGATLFEAGDDADAAYSLVSGRLEVYLDGAAVRLLGPGAVIGELALLTSGTRSATVRARRDSELLRLRPDALLDVMEKHPGAGGAVARVLAGQLAHPAPTARRTDTSRTVAVVGLHAGAPAREVARALETSLSRHGSVGSPGPVDGDGLERAERDHDVVVLVADVDAGRATPPGGRAPCARPTSSSRSSPAVSSRPAPGRRSRRVATSSLSVPCSTRGPRRPGPRPSTRGSSPRCDEVTPASVRPLADRLAGRSLGLVLAGGGARALTHVGVLAALEEAGIAVDRIAGCSIGAIVAALHATGMTTEELKDRLYAEFVRRRPFSDYTVPRAALAKGQRVHAALERSFAGRHIEGLPRQFRCVSTDLLSRTVVVHRRGTMVDALRATTALPGLFPPVRLDGRLLVDGGVLANLPTDALLERDEGPVVAVNVGMGGTPSDASRDPARPLRIPLLGETLLRTMLIGSAGAAAGARAAGLVVVTPPTLGVGLLEFHQFDAMYEAGLTTGRRLVAEGALPG